jgi:hypothetical protein
MDFPIESQDTVDLMSEDPGISISEYAESVLTNLRFFGF